MIVMKFGGTSVGNAAMIEQTSEIIRRSLARRPVVVVSAVSKVTDALIEAARQSGKGSYKIPLEAIEEKHSQIIAELGIDRSIISGELRELREALEEISESGLTKKLTDLTVSFGERMSAKILAECCRKNGLKAEAHNAYDLGMITDDNFGAAEVLSEAHQKLNDAIARLPEGTIPIITGYIAKAHTGEITTLGRGGSDYSAAIIGAAINAEEVQIWTDVNGMMTTDPRIVPEAKTISTVSFEEASELAYLGAKVLHPKTILPVIRKSIPVMVLNTFNPEADGTAILNMPGNGAAITAIACKKDVTVISISSARMFLMHGFLHKTFKMFDEHRVSVDMIATSEVTVSVTVDGRENGDIQGLLDELRATAEVSIEENRASVFVVGRGIKRTPGISSRIFTALANRGINVEMISQGASEINIGLVVKEEECDEAILALHREFFGQQGVDR